MLTQARIAHSRAARPLILQKRLFATPPPSRPAVVLSTPNATTVVTPLPVGTPPVAPSGAPIPPSASGTLPLPPPRQPRRPRRFFRRFFVYTALGVLTFYPLSGWLSTQYEGYRDFFVDTFPGGEFVADYADDHNWETFGAGSVSKKAVQGWQKVTGEEARPGSTKEDAANRLRELQRQAEAAGKKVQSEGKSVLKDLESRAKDAAASVKAKAGELTEAGKKEIASLRQGAHETKDKAENKVASLRPGPTDEVVGRDIPAVKGGAPSLREPSTDTAHAVQQGLSLRDDAVVARPAASLRDPVGDLKNAARRESVSLRESAHDLKNEAKREVASLRDSASSAADRASGEVKREAATLRDSATDLVDRASTEAKREAASLRDFSDRAGAEVKREAASLRDSASDLAHRASTEMQRETTSLRDSASNLADRASTEIKRETVSLRESASNAAEEIKREGMSLRDSATDAVDRFKSAVKTESITLREQAGNAADKAKALASDAQHKLADVTSDAKAKASETTSALSNKADQVARDAERALHKGEAKVGQAVDQTEAALKRGESKVENAARRAKSEVEKNPGSQYLDTQRPRELRPETVKREKPTFDGQTVYAAPLPVGHEPPPGYYIPPPPISRVTDSGTGTLPLLAPKIKEFAASEPIVTQLASTIDSLASSLSTPSSGEPNKILTRAQDDLTALSKQLEDSKKAERAKLEQTVAEKTKEFEALLKTKEQERAKGEQGLKQGWEKEKSSMVDNWRGDLEKELESQRQGIEQRLREEVVSQGIELQRRWLRSIKSQVETERGGRLAKLDHLSSSLKQLERITLDNSATLDDNVRLHKVWSALRAVQAKAESGDVSFDEELKLLRSLSSEQSVASVTLAQLEQSGIATSGVKSFAALASWFSNGVSPRVHSASLVPKPEEASVLSHVASATFSKVMFTPKAGLIDGDDVSSTLARAEWCLGEKDLDGAAREVNSLKGWPGKLAADWLREARRRLEVQQALEVVGAEATLGSLLLV